MDGFNGTADILWDEDFLMTNARSNGGVRCVDTSHRSGRTAAEETLTVDENKDKRCFTGVMTREQSKHSYTKNFAWENIVQWYLHLNRVGIVGQKYLIWQYPTPDLFCWATSLHQPPRTIISNFLITAITRYKAKSYQ